MCMPESSTFIPGDIGNQLGRSFKIVGQKYVSGTVFGVNNNDLTEFLGIALRTFIPGEGADNIRHYALGKPSFPCPRLYPHIGFRPYDEERLDAVNGVEVGEIVVAPVENVMRTRLVRYSDIALESCTFVGVICTNAGTSASTS